MANNKMALSSISKIREVYALIEKIENTSIVNILEEMEEMKELIDNLEKDLIYLLEESTNLQKVKRYIRLKESLK